MSREYSYKLDNRLNNYTICCDGVDLSAERVVELLDGVESTVQPSYYSVNGVSPLDCFKEGLISREELVGFCKGNIIKYVCRAGLKKGESEVKDLSKASVYLAVLMDLSKDKH